MSNTEGTALLFESKWLPSASYLPPPPIDSICDITGTEKTRQLVELDRYKTRLFIQLQDIWLDCIVPQEKYNVFNISN